MIDLLGKGIAGRSGSYKKMVWQRDCLARGTIQRHDDAYSKLEAHSAAGKILIVSLTAMGTWKSASSACLPYWTCPGWSSRSIGCDETSTAARSEPRGKDAGPSVLAYAEDRQYTIKPQTPIIV